MGFLVLHLLLASGLPGHHHSPNCQQHHSPLGPLPDKLMDTPLVARRVCVL